MPRPLTLRNEDGQRPSNPNVSAPADAGKATAACTLDRGSLIGRYLVLSLVGRGGMGEVYAAYDPELDRRVAIKLMRAVDGLDTKRLVREARALGKLSHPNVVQVHDVGEHEGDVFVAMELVEGQSLDAWCRGAPRPGWKAVLAAYLDAARGLSAAHEKGLVHRDVKPSNILRGKDGRVRVVDFGLAAGRDVRPPRDSARPPIGAGGSRAQPMRAPARALDPGSAPRPPIAACASTDPRWPLDDTLPSAPDDPEPSSSAATLQAVLDWGVTVTDGLMGTPVYMAPEQYEGPRVGPASDQYSLCVAIYQGLYGTLPFEIAQDAELGGALDRLRDQKKRGAVLQPPAGASVPGRVLRALARGLAPRPEDRYPSLDALSAALSDDPDARWRARLRHLGVAASLAAVLAVAAAGWARSGAFHDPCEHPERQLSGVWDEPARARLRSAFARTGRAYAEGTAARVASLFDRHAAEWAGMRGEVCAASRDDRQGREVLGLRDACLVERRVELQALVTVFTESPDPEVLDSAVQAAAGVHPIADCADVEALTARVRPPEDPALRGRAAKLEIEVHRLEALFSAGKFKDGLALGQPLHAEATAIAYPPLRAQVEFWSPEPEASSMLAQLAAGITGQGDGS